MHKLLLTLFLAPLPLLAQGTCPSGANYVNPANPTGPLVTLSSLGVTGCYYVSAAGSDSNDGKTEATAWRHAPGMGSCTSGACHGFDNNLGGDGSFPPATGLIFRGGDSWTANNGDLPWTWRSKGSPGSPIYLGYDPGWYSGSSWTRPKLDLNNNTSSTYNVLGAAFTSGGGNQATYIQLDNFEFANLYSCQPTGSGNNGYVWLNSSNEALTRNYFHGWTHCSTANVPDGCQLAYANLSSGQSAYTFELNIWDGTDSTNGGDSCYALYNGGSDTTSTVAFNYIKNVANGIVGSWPFVHDNTILNINQDYAQLNGFGTYHGNGLENNVCNSPCFIYNNVIQTVAQAAGVTFWDSPTGSYDYIFNNVIVDATDGNVMNTVTGTGNQAHNGYVKAFNNTVECGHDSGPPAYQCSGDANSSSAASYFLNNHYITSSSPPPPLSFWGTQSNNVTQTKSTANGQSYSLAQTYAFSPANGTGSTVGAGVNQQSLCNTIAGLNSAAGAACQSDTTYGVSYNASNHTVSWPARTPVTRPINGAAWDAGAYQISAGSPPPGDTPSTLTTPISGSFLQGGPALFVGTNGTGATGVTVTGYYLWVGSTAGGYDIANGGPFGSPMIFAQLPTTPQTLYARLWTYFSDNTRQYTDSVYTIPTLAAMLTCTPGGMSSGSATGMLPAGSKTFTWAPGDANAQGYFLWIGRQPGTSNLVNVGPLTTTSYSHTFAENGVLYARLWTKMTNGQLLYNDYVYANNGN